MHSILISKPQKIYTAYSFSLSARLSLLFFAHFFSLSLPRLFYLHGQVPDSKKEKKKPQMVQIQSIA